MKYKAALVVLIGVFATGMNVSIAEEKVLSKEEAVALFKDKTFDGYQEVKGKGFRIYSAADGTHNVHFPGGKTKTRYWSINDEGEHCVSKSEGKGGRCSVVKAIGDGVYHKITEGEHTHTLKNFVDGNQI